MAFQNFVRPYIQSQSMSLFPNTWSNKGNVIRNFSLYEKAFQPELYDSCLGGPNKEVSPVRP